MMIATKQRIRRFGFQQMRPPEIPSAKSAIGIGKPMLRGCSLAASG
jgi:hypothetical protein